MRFGMTFGEKLELLRGEKGWTQPQAAEIVGTSASQWWRWVNDETDPFADRPDLQSSGSPARKAKAKAKPEPGKPTGKPTRGRYPNRPNLVRMAEVFGVDLLWLIDDRKGLEERPTLVGPLAERFKRLSPEDAIAMLEMWSATRADRPHRNGGRGGAANSA